MFPQKHDPESIQQHEPLIRQIECVTELSSEDRRAIAGLPMRTRSIRKGADIAREADVVTESCLVLSGLVCRYKVIAGGRRQILSFHFAGDMPDLQSLYFGRMDHGLTALTGAEVAMIPHEAIRLLVDRHAGVRTAFARHAAVDGSIFRQWIVNTGRRTALERIAHLICECFVRSRALGLATGKTFSLPLTQAELGDATGLSNVHVNRTLQQLRHERIIHSDRSSHTILDWIQLQRTADFNADYLHLRGNPAN